MIRFKLQKNQLPRINFLYLLIGLLTAGLAILLIAVNLIWLESFVSQIKARAVDYLMLAARRSAESTEEFIKLEIGKIKELSENIAVAGKPEFFVSRFLKLNPAVEEVSIINLEGREEKRFSRKKYFTEEDLRSFIYLEKFEQAKKGKIFISKVDFTEAGEPYVLVTYPIRKFEGAEPQAILSVVLHLQEIWKIALGTKIGETGRLSVVDDKGMLIADPDPSRVLRRTDISKLPPVKSLILREDFGKFIYLNEKGEEVVGIGTSIQFLGWGVIIEQNVSEIEAPAQELKIFIRLFSAAGIIVVVFLGWIALILRNANKELIKRTRSIKEKTLQLEEAKGVLEIKVNARTKELKELTDNLEKEVKKRTKDLQERVEELERFHKLTVGRELKMVELKKEVKELKKLLKVEKNN